MSDKLEAIKRYFANDRFAATNGIEMTELKPGLAKAQMKIQEKHLNSVGIVQGGAIFTLADFAFAGACNSSGQVTLAINMNLSCLKAVSAGTLHAEAVEISRSRRIASCTVRVTNDADELVAIFQGTSYIKKEPFPPQA